MEMGGREAVRTNRQRAGLDDHLAGVRGELKMMTWFTQRMALTAKQQADRATGKESSWGGRG